MQTLSLVEGGDRLAALRHGRRPRAGAEINERMHRLSTTSTRAFTR
jgi:hypothetical protein